jgi:hypothetical protein
MDMNLEGSERLFPIHHRFPAEVDSCPAEELARDLMPLVKVSVFRTGAGFHGLDKIRGLLRFLGGHIEPTFGDPFDQHHRRSLLIFNLEA